jgi:hypothetical protein
VRRLVHRSLLSFQLAGVLVSAKSFQFHNVIHFALAQIAVAAAEQVL